MIRWLVTLSHWHIFFLTIWIHSVSCSFPLGCFDFGCPKKPSSGTKKSLKHEIRVSIFGRSLRLFVMQESVQRTYHGGVTSPASHHRKRSTQWSALWYRWRLKRDRLHPMLNATARDRISRRIKVMILCVEGSRKAMRGNHFLVQRRASSTKRIFKYRSLPLSLFFVSENSRTRFVSFMREERGFSVVVGCTSILCHHHRGCSLMFPECSQSRNTLMERIFVRWNIGRRFWDIHGCTH